jgi:hypothetical protein
MTRRRSSLFLGASLAVASAVSCSDTTEPDSTQIVATVEFLNVEGGCWTLLACDGVRYEPANLADRFREDGLQVAATVRPIEEVASVCQVGTIVEIEGIRRRD